MREEVEGESWHRVIALRTPFVPPGISRFETKTVLALLGRIKRNQDSRFKRLKDKTRGYRKREIVLFVLALSSQFLFHSTTR